jgi:DNA invertase Pin-like site-specific DNA recombinase
VFSDEVAGRTAGRPELASCLASLRPGDTLIVPSLERLSHSVLRARELLADSHATVASVARQLGVGRSSLYRHLPELAGRAQSNGRSADVDAHFARAGSDRQPDGDRSTLGPGAATPEGHRSCR